MNRSTRRLSEYFQKLENISRELFKNGKNDYKLKFNQKINNNIKYGDLNFFNEEALDYDNKYFELTNTKCDMDNEDDCFFYYNEIDICFCASCIMRNEILNMIERNKNYGKNIIFDLRGNKLQVVITRQLPVVKRRGNHYFLLVKSKIKSFNIYYPMCEIFQRFYYLNY